MPETKLDYIFPDIPILKSDFWCRDHCRQLPPDIYTSLYYKLLFEKYMKIIERWGKPYKITSGWRCPQKIFQMIIDRTANAAVSPHAFGAIDTRLQSAAEARAFAALASNTCPDLRVGLDSYLKAGLPIVHLDQAYLISPRPSSSWIEGFKW